jgi:hypothetical protein
MPTRPKTGDKRKTRQPLKIDKLPAEVRDQIQQLRADGKTWTEIEELSAEFVKWDSLPTHVLELFPDMRLPHSSLQRWWDLRVDQVKAELMARAEKAREIAAAFADSKFEELPAAVEGALRDQIFSLMQASDMSSRGKVITELQKLARLLVQQKRLEILDERTKAETKRVELLTQDFEMRKRKFEEETDKAAKKLGKGKAITTDDINRIRERTFGLPPIQASSSSAA